MKYLFAKQNNLEKHIANKFVLLLLDYDGTLTPIVENPDKALISKKTRDLLKKLSVNLRCRIAIVTGRAAKDIKGKIGIKNIIYASNYGLQIQGPKIKFTAPLPADFHKVLRKIKSHLKKTLRSVKGLLLEDKKVTISVHYRLVNNQYVSFVVWTLLKITTPYIHKKEIVVNFGKKVFEIKPPIEWNKGIAVLWLLNKHKPAFLDRPILPIYIGDDTSDEDAFETLKDKGLTIFVGHPKKSHAKYYLRNTREVFKFLKILKNLLS
jgi:trehalose-phosphatase